MAESVFTKRWISHDEARAAAQRFIDAHFGNAARLQRLRSRCYLETERAMMTARERARARWFCRSPRTLGEAMSALSLMVALADRDDGELRRQLAELAETMRNSAAKLPPKE